MSYYANTDPRDIESPAITPSQPNHEDESFVEWLDSLDPNSDDRRAFGPPPSLWRRLTFRLKTGYSVDKLGYLSREEQLKEMNRLERTAHKRQAAKARSKHRQQWKERGSLFGALILTVTVLAGYGTIIGYGLIHPEKAEAQTAQPAGQETHHAAGKCGLLFGKPACAGREHETTKPPKKPKVTHLVCSDQLYSIGPPGCSDLDEGTDTDGQPIAPRCKLMIKCKRVNGPDPTVYIEPR